MHETPALNRLAHIGMQRRPSIFLFDGVNLFLQKLKGREENSIHGAGSAHGHAQPPVHMPAEELNFHLGHCLAPGVHQTVTLIYALRGIDGICSGLLDGYSIGGCFPAILTNHRPGYYSAESTRNQDRQRVRMSTITTKGRQELLAALVCHKVNASAQRVSHYIIS